MSHEFNVRALNINDWEAFKAIRLEALQAHGNVYGSSYSLEKDNTREQWQGYLDGGNKQIMGGFDGSKLVGLSAVFTDRSDASGKTAVLAMWYMKPEYRRSGLFEQMVEASIDWAEAQPTFDKIIVSHRDGNEASRKANQKFGFVFTRKSLEDWPDGQKADQHYYERNIVR